MEGVQANAWLKSLGFTEAQLVAYDAAVTKAFESPLNKDMTKKERRLYRSKLAKNFKRYCNNNTTGKYDRFFERFAIHNSKVKDNDAILLDASRRLAQMAKKFEESKIVKFGDGWWKAYQQPPQSSNFQVQQQNFAAPADFQNQTDSQEALFRRLNEIDEQLKALNEMDSKQQRHYYDIGASTNS